MNEHDLVALIHQIIDPDDGVSSEQLDEMQEEFIDSIPHPGGSDLIFYPETWGLDPSATAEEIARAALAWRPRVVVATVTYVRPHPNRNDLTCYGIKVEGQFQTQVLSSLSLAVGDRCAVALSGVKLADRTVVNHDFVDGVFSAGMIISKSDEPGGTELPV